MTHPWLMGDMEGVFNTMKATGKSQFSLEEIQAFVQQASKEAGERHYQEFLNEHSETVQLAGHAFDQLPPPQPNEELEL